MTGQVFQTAEIGYAYSAFCSTKSEGMSSKGFTKLCRHAELVTGSFDDAELKHICDEVLPRKKYHMSLAQFQVALAMLSQKLCIQEELIRQKVEAAGGFGQLSDMNSRSSARAERPQPSTRTQSPVHLLGPLSSLSRSPASGTPFTPTMRLDTCSVPAKTPKDKSEVCQNLDSSDALPKVPSATRLPTDETSTLTSQPSLRQLLKSGARSTVNTSRRGESAEARDALDVFLLFSAEAAKENAPAEQRKHFRDQASKALSLAMLAEARESLIEVGPQEVQQAKETAHGALDFLFLSAPQLAIDAHDLEELRVHALDAVRVALLGIRTSGDREYVMALAPQALGQVFTLTSKALRGKFSRKEMEEAKESARAAVGKAVLGELQCGGITIESDELKRAKRRVHSAMDSIFLAEPKLCAAGDFSAIKKRALDALHLAILGIMIKC
jgi:hypothetical protein